MAKTDELIAQAERIRDRIALETEKLRRVEEALARRGNTCYEEDNDAEETDRSTDSD